MEKFTFWAQALDNSSPDHMDKRGEELSPDDSYHRNEVVALVSAVVKRGTRVFESNGVQLTVDKHHFVLEVPSAERDQAGRIAPIVCYGNYDPVMQSVGNAFGASVAVGLHDFATRIGRSLQPEHVELVDIAFVELKKKSTWSGLTDFRAAVLRLLAQAYHLISLVLGKVKKGFAHCLKRG
jgi:hypothetical protein